MRDQLQRKTDCALADVERRRDGDVVLSAGSCRPEDADDEEGRADGVPPLDDLSGEAETVVFNCVYAAARDLCVADGVLVVKGRVDHKQAGDTKLIASR